MECLTVFQWTKIQNWKLITTVAVLKLFQLKLYFNELRYKIESLSQHCKLIWHCYITVFQWTKIQNWKLITTGDTRGNMVKILYFNELRYKIESLSQPSPHLQLDGIRLYFNELRYKIESLSQHRTAQRLISIDCISMN